VSETKCTKTSQYHTMQETNVFNDQMFPCSSNSFVHPIKSFRWCDCEGSSDHLLLVWPVPLAQVFPLPQLIFPFKTWFFKNLLEFSAAEIIKKNQYLPHSESKSYQINSIKSCSSRSFQQHQRHIPIPPKNLATIKFNFQI